MSNFVLMRIAFCRGVKVRQPANAGVFPVVASVTPRPEIRLRWQAKGSKNLFQGRVFRKAR